MLGISLPYLVHLANVLDQLGTLPDEDTPRGDHWLTLYQAHGQIEALTRQSFYAPYLRSSFAMSQELLTMLDSEIKADLGTSPTIGKWTYWRIKDKWKNYRIALLADLGALEAYFIVQQGGYDTRTLTQFGENTFPTDMIPKVPETLFDAREATKCLAYAVPTAAGFHIFRILEAVLRKYYAIVTGGKAAPKVRNIGVYLNALKQANKGDPIVLAVLKQIADLHRNPLIHPETALLMDEALAAHGIVKAAVFAMLREIPVQPVTTTNQPLTLQHQGALPA